MSALHCVLYGVATANGDDAVVLLLVLLLFVAPSMCRGGHTAAVTAVRRVPFF